MVFFVWYYGWNKSKKNEDMHSIGQSYWWRNWLFCILMWQHYIWMHAVTRHLIFIIGSLVHPFPILFNVHVVGNMLNFNNASGRNWTSWDWIVFLNNFSGFRNSRCWVLWKKLLRCVWSVLREFTSRVTNETYTGICPNSFHYIVLVW